jgi:hypothetical protein
MVGSHMHTFLSAPNWDQSSLGKHGCNIVAVSEISQGGKVLKGCHLTTKVFEKGYDQKSKVIRLQDGVLPVRSWPDHFITTISRTPFLSAESCPCMKANNYVDSQSTVPLRQKVRKLVVFAVPFSRVPTSRRWTGRTRRNPDLV